MPVRVNPPPAEIGETISPRCASFETTMPSKGERTVQLSTSCWATPMRASAARVCSLVRAIFERKLSAVVRAASRAWTLLTPAARSDSARFHSRSALPSWTSRSASAAAVASRSVLAEASDALGWEQSSSASTCPLLTCRPSSANICSTRPVTFAATVARRRGVT